MGTLLVINFVLFFSLFSPTPSLAGQLSTPNATLTWNDDDFYVPNKFNCSQFTFTITIDKSVSTVFIAIFNKYNERIGQIFTYASGQANLQVCNNNIDIIGTYVSFEVTQFAGYGGVKTVKAPIEFKNRDSVTPKIQAAATPKPTQTSNTEEKSSFNSVESAVFDELQRRIVGLQSEVKNLKNRIKKICSSSPKPKGC